LETNEKTTIDDNVFRQTKLDMK